MTAGFFPPRWVPDREPEPDPRGWLAYVDGRIEIPEDGGRRIAQDLGAVDTDRARIALSWVDVHPDLVAFEVRSELRIPPVRRAAAHCVWSGGAAGHPQSGTVPPGCARPFS